MDRVKAHPVSRILAPLLLSKILACKPQAAGEDGIT